MASFDSLLMRYYAVRGVGAQVGDDVNSIAPVAIRLKYVGTGTVTSVTTTTATNIVMITSDGGTDTYAFATYTTVGALVDKINSDGIFQAKVLDSLRSYATASQFVTGAITAAIADTSNGDLVWDVLVDTSAAKYFAYRITVDRGFTKNKLKSGHRVHLQEIVYYATLGGAGANLMQVWGIKGTTETQKLGYLSVSATKTTQNFASGQGKVSGEEGEDIVVVLKDGTSIADAAANYLQVVGQIE